MADSFRGGYRTGSGGGHQRGRDLDVRHGETWGPPSPNEACPPGERLLEEVQQVRKGKGEQFPMRKVTLLDHRHLGFNL